MFKKIMTPVDLTHQDQMERALQCGADLARHYGAPVVYVGVSATTPSAVAHTPEEFTAKLAAFAAGQASRHGVEASSLPKFCGDPATDVDDALLAAAEETGADLVVMASHIPTALDHVWPSNGGKVAEYAKASVLVVRTPA